MDCKFPNIKGLVLSCLLLFFTAVLFAQSSGGLKLWYDHPSGDQWENALPVGNGKLGAMIYGNVDTETVQLNEHTLWSGSPNRNDNPMALDSLEEIRSLIFSGQQKRAEELANRVIVSRQSQGQMFEPAGELHLAFNGHQQFSDYYRELDIERALAKTIYKVDGITYTRETIASFPDRVIVMQLRANKPKSISFSAFYSTPEPNTIIQTTAKRDLTLSGTTIDHEGVKGMVKYTCITRFRQEGGTISSTQNDVSIKNADAVTIYISIATNFINYHNLGGNEQKTAMKFLDNASLKSFSQMVPAHVRAYQKYFNRVKIDLGTTDAARQPTDQRLKKFDSANDPQLVSLYYQFGRYLLISSSQPGGQPCNLQGIWNNKLYPPWDSKYTININAEMNYWPAEKTNLAELHQPFLQMVREMSVTGSRTAREMYGTRGWMAHHNTDIWRSTGAVDGAFWGIWNNGGGWTSQHIWEHYLYSGDKNFLAENYPVLKNAALFYEDFLVEHPQYHWLVVCPDMSPENASSKHGGSSLDAGVTMTNQIVFDVFTNAIQAAQILNTDKKLVDTLKKLRNRLPPMQIGQYGQLQEWLDDVDDPHDHHRHISQLYGLFPSAQISPFRNPKLSAAAKNTLEQRGDVSTGWSMGWKVNWWAKLLDGNHAYRLIQKQLTPAGTQEGGGTYNNLFDAHPPFQIDGNFGCTSGITEMLMQTADGSVFLLPALPDAWPSGTINGLRARGGFEILRMHWEQGKLKSLVIKSKLGGNLRIRVPNEMKLVGDGDFKKAGGENRNSFFWYEQPKEPIISEKAVLSVPELKSTLLYDLSTLPGQICSFISK